MISHTIVCKTCGNRSTLFINDLFDDRYGAPGRYSIYRCLKCGFGYKYPKLKKKEIGKFYAKYYPLLLENPDSIRKAIKLPNKILSWLSGSGIAAHRYITAGSSVLDIGSASGISLFEIERLGSRAYGVEPDPNAQKIAKELNLRVYTGFITDGPYPGVKFDCITATQVIEHDPDPKTFLQAVHKYLKKDGKVIMSFPNIDSLYRIIFGKYWVNWHVPYHCNFFTKKAFILLADSLGFKIQKIITITPNDWTIVQLMMCFQKPQEGKTGFVWSTINDSKVKSRSIIFKAVKKILIYFALIPITIMNRFIDMLGYGDSFLVIMEKKK